MSKLRATSVVLSILVLTSGAGLAQEDQPALSQKDLAGRRFRFAWKSGDTGGFNGIATLRKDGTIVGIASPNETTWFLDDQGRLVFKHRDGRVSTVFDKIERRGGRYHFAGPFQFREGIVHLLEEVGDEVAAPVKAPGLNELVKRYSSQEIVCLDVGEGYTFRLRSGKERTVRLVSVKETRDSVLGKVRRARVDVDIDGKPFTLDCGPYVMPTEIDGLRLQADTTSSGWGHLPKAVQLSIWDATVPIVNTDRFSFPVRDFRLFSHGMQAYGEVVHLGLGDGDPKSHAFHHDYGIDLAGYEGGETITSCTDGEIVQLWPAPADASTVVIADQGGFLWSYCHLDSLAPHLKLGIRITRGQPIGQLGRKGGSGNFSHIHVGTFLDKRDVDEHRWNIRLNLYPWVVTAYEEQYGNGLYAVARPDQVAVTGETVVLDGSRSMVFDGNVVSYRWELPNGKVVNNAKAETVFGKPGVYMATLWIKDDEGREDVDFCRVKVFTKAAPERGIPTIFMTHTPTKNLAIGRSVCFRLWLQGGNSEPIRIDFGDGTVIEDYVSYAKVSHTFKRTGIHIITAHATVGGKPVTQKQKVIVGIGDTAGVEDEDHDTVRQVNGG